MVSTIRYASFLIRVWREEHADAAGTVGDWQSEVEHIQSGKRWAFESMDELLDFLRIEADSLPGWQTEAPEPGSGPTGPDVSSLWSG